MVLFYPPAVTYCAEFFHQAIYVLAKCDDGQNLRNELRRPLKHIRLCSLSPEDFCNEVAPTKVLRKEEIGAVCVSIGNKKKQFELTEICNEITVRQAPIKSKVFQKVWKLTGELYVVENVFTIKTMDSAIEILYLTIATVCNGRMYNFTVDIEEILGSGARYSLTLCETNLYGGVSITISNWIQKVLLLPNSEYTFRIKCNRYFCAYSTMSTQPTDEHFTIQYLREKAYGGHQLKCIKMIHYRLVDPKQLGTTQ